MRQRRPSSSTPRSSPTARQEEPTGQQPLPLNELPWHRQFLDHGAGAAPPASRTRGLHVMIPGAGSQHHPLNMFPGGRTGAAQRPALVHAMSSTVLRITNRCPHGVIGARSNQARSPAGTARCSQAPSARGVARTALKVQPITRRSRMGQTPALDTPVPHPHVRQFIQDDGAGRFRWQLIPFRHRP